MITYFCVTEGLKLTSTNRKLYISSSLFIDCSTSSSGGAIYSSSSLLSVFSSSFIHCNSTNDGGSIYSSNPLLLSCISFTNSAAKRCIAFYSESLSSSQISCAYCSGNTSTFRTYGSNAKIKSTNISFSNTDYQNSCFALFSSSSFDVKFLTCTHSSEHMSASFEFYYASGLFSFGNAYNITTQEKGYSGFIVVGLGANVTFTNSSFHHNGHAYIVSLYDAIGNESILIQDCQFVSQLNSFSIDCIETHSVIFTDVFSYLQYEIEGPCEHPPQSHIENMYTKKTFLFQFLFLLYSRS